MPRTKTEAFDTQKRILGRSLTEGLPRLRDVLRRDPCSYCGRRLSGRGKGAATVDHIDPRSRRTHWSDDGFANLTAACRACNWAKSTRSLLEFMWERRPA